MTDVGDTVPLLRFLRSDALIPMIHPVPGLAGSNGATMTFTRGIGYKLLQINPKELLRSQRRHVLRHRHLLSQNFSHSECLPGTGQPVPSGRQLTIGTLLSATAEMLFHRQFGCPAMSATPGIPSLMLGDAHDCCCERAELECG